MKKAVILAIVAYLVYWLYKKNQAEKSTGSEAEPTEKSIISDVSGKVVNLIDYAKSVAAPVITGTRNPEPVTSNLQPISNPPEYAMYDPVAFKNEAIASMQYAQEQAYLPDENLRRFKLNLISMEV